MSCVGLLLGLLGAWAKLAGARPVRALANAYTTVVRGVPDILLILFVYYGGTTALRAVGLLLCSLSRLRLPLRRRVGLHPPFQRLQPVIQLADPVESALEAVLLRILR